jgi:hypothetical protein
MCPGVSQAVGEGAGESRSRPSRSPRREMVDADQCLLEAWRLRHLAQLAKDPEITRQYLELAAYYDQLATTREAIEGESERD